jgi:serine/threonine protein kinase/tetratricopeptide (TPR) repeat protein
MSGGRSEAEGPVGAVASRYEIVTKIGAGGMGDVYRAHDPKMGRDVALKILPDRFRDEPSRIHRFEKEVRAVGALNHPNILAVHDVGVHNDCPFLVSELLEGSTLRERMDSGDLTIRRALQLAAEVAEGLSAAHARGIIHRDIKPGNVFVTADGHAKVLDFGVAKLAEEHHPIEHSTRSDTEVLATQSGTLIGTPAYMSPEQIQGLEIDHRSDVFSFGVMLYEMLSGGRPFTGDTAAQLAISIIRDDPPPLATTDGRVPRAVEEVILRCLEKKPEERFHSAHDLALALGAAAAGHSGAVPAPQIRRPIPWRRIAVVSALAVVVLVSAWALRRVFAPPPLPDRLHLTVLPFTADSAINEPFARGLTSTFEKSLALLEEQNGDRLSVLSRHISDNWNTPSLEQRQRYFGVTLGVAGALHKGSERITLHLSLVDASTQTTIRSMTIDHDALNLIAFQSEPLLVLADSLGVEVGPVVMDRLKQMSTNVVAAYEPYLRGVGLMETAADPHDLERAAAAIAESTDADRFFTPATIARAEISLQRFSSSGSAEDLDDARRWADRAGELQSSGFRGHLALARVERAAGNIDAELDALRRAIDAAPNRASLQREYAESLWSAGDREGAIATYERWIFLQPGEFDAYWGMAYRLLEMDDVHAAANRFRQAIDIAPLNPWGYNGLGSIMYLLEQRDEARSAFEQSVSVEPTYVALSNLGTLEFEDGRYGNAARHFEEALTLDGGDRQTWAFLGTALHWGGSPERAVPAFKKAVEIGERELVDSPDDPLILANVGGSYGMLGEVERGLPLVEKAALQELSDPQTMAAIAEAFEDLDERERAMQWILRALGAGLEPKWIERRPSMQDLRADPRYRAAVEAPSSLAPSEKEDS